MPRKPSTVLVMRDYPPLSARRWYEVQIVGVLCGVREITFQLSIIAPPEQAGRSVASSRPAILTPNSPLSEFLARGLGIELACNESLDMATLTGRRLDARFAQTGTPSTPNVVAVRCSERRATDRPRSANRSTGDRSPTPQSPLTETKHGLE